MRVLVTVALALILSACGQSGKLKQVHGQPVGAWGVQGLEGQS